MRIRVQGSLFAGLVLAVLLVSSAAAADSAKSSDARPGLKQAVVSVKGLSCPVCARRLEKVLSKTPGAKSAQVNLEKEQALVNFDASAKVRDSELTERVRDAGFVPGKIEWHDVQASGRSAEK